MGVCARDGVFSGFCIVAVRLFSRLRQNAAEPVALAALDRILRDEVRHRDFGWTLSAQ